MLGVEKCGYCSECVRALSGVVLEMVERAEVRRLPPALGPSGGR